MTPKSGRSGSSTGGRLARVGVEHLEAALVTATKSDSVDEVPVRALSSSAYRFALDPTPSRTPCCGRTAAGSGTRSTGAGAGDGGDGPAERGSFLRHLPDAELTPSLSWSAYSLRKLWNQAKTTVAPWWAENSKEAYSSGLANLAT